MANKKIVLIIVLVFGLSAFFILRNTQPKKGASKVYIKSGVLFLKKRPKNGFFARSVPHIIKGVTWSPASMAPESGSNPLNPSETVPYGYFFDWPGRNPQGHVILNYWLKSEFKKRYKTDIALMKELNINTVRVYNDFGDDPAVYNAILDEFYDNGIMVIITLNITKEDFKNNFSGDLTINKDSAIFNVVENYKNHPAVLFWSIGNEWNLNKHYGNSDGITTSIEVVNALAKEIKKKDPMHPVASCVGDLFRVESDNLCGFSKDAELSYIVAHCPEVEIWGINVYRGRSFQSIFNDWKSITNKPFYFSEFGTDSFSTESFVKFNSDPCDYRITSCTGNIDESLQAKTDVALWREIRPHLAALHRGELCQGGLVHEFNDELWKVGSYHTGLGDLIVYDTPGEHSYDQYDYEGASIGESHPDKVSNEEYFGLVDAYRGRKKAFYALADEFAEVKP